MDSNRKLIFMIIIAVILVIVSVLFSVSVILSGNISGALWAVLIPLNLILIFFIFSKRYHSSEIKGVPVEDERSKKAKMYAAGYAYFVSLYIWLALMFFREHFNQSQIFVIGMVGMILSFFISWFILSRRANI